MGSARAYGANNVNRVRLLWVFITPYPFLAVPLLIRCCTALPWR